MKILLGVSRQLIDIESGKAYWCVNRKQSVQINDLVLIYVKRKGISQIFVVSDITQPLAERKCRIRNMMTIYLKHLFSFETPLTAKLMREHAELKALDVLRKNFQTTTVILEAVAGQQIIDYLKQLNPKQAAGLSNL